MTGGVGRGGMGWFDGVGKQGRQFRGLRRAEGHGKGWVKAGREGRGAGSVAGRV